MASIRKNTQSPKRSVKRKVKAQKIDLATPSDFEDVPTEIRKEAYDLTVGIGDQKEKARILIERGEIHSVFKPYEFTYKGEKYTLGIESKNSFEELEKWLNVVADIWASLKLKYGGRKTVISNSIENIKNGSEKAASKKNIKAYIETEIEDTRAELKEKGLSEYRKRGIFPDIEFGHTLSDARAAINFTELERYSEAKALIRLEYWLRKLEPAKMGKKKKIVKGTLEELWSKKAKVSYAQFIDYAKEAGVYSGGEWVVRTIKEGYIIIRLLYITKLIELPYEPDRDQAFKILLTIRKKKASKTTSGPAVVLQYNFDELEIEAKRIRGNKDFGIIVDRLKKAGVTY